MAMTLELSHQPMHPIFIPWCAGASRHERLLRKHIPDSDPGCALQSTSMPALHRRNVPICRPMVDGGMRKCSAVEDFARRGACPPLGSGWGVAESAAPIRCTKPQLRLFIPWRAGGNRHERLLRKQTPNSSLRRSKACPVPRYGAGVQGWGNPLAPQPVSSHRRIGTPFRRSGPPFVIPAPAGIHAPSLRLRTSIAIPPTTTTRIHKNPASQSAIPATSYPYPIRRPTPQRAAAPMTPGYLHLAEPSIAAL